MLGLFVNIGVDPVRSVVPPPVVLLGERAPVVGLPVERLPVQLLADGQQLLLRGGVGRCDISPLFFPLSLLCCKKMNSSCCAPPCLSPRWSITRAQPWSTPVLCRHSSCSFILATL